MILDEVNEVLENFYKLFYETETLALKQGLKTLTITELHIIEAIGETIISMNKLSEKLGITMGTSTIAVKKLLEKGYLVRKRSEKDRRKVMVSLSEKGKNALEYHNEYHTKIIKKITKNITEDKLKNFINIYKEIFENLNDQIDYFRPKPIGFFQKNEALNVVEIKGTPLTKRYLKENGIEEYTEIKILSKKNNELILSNYKNEKIKINTIDGKNIIVVKQEK